MRRLWLGLFGVIAVAFAVLLWAGRQIYVQAPPIPARVVTSDGQQVVAPGEIHLGQNVWQSLGGMELGSIWGHGSYVAPDWTADWLHREATFMLDAWSRDAYGVPFAQLDAPRQAQLQARLQEEERKNTFDPKTGTLVISPLRAKAYEANQRYLADVFGNGRDAYAIPPGALTDAARQRALGAFVFWTSWAATTNRPGQALTYTSNWPSEPLVGNVPPPSAWVWTGVSVLLLLAGIGAMAFWHASRPPPEIHADIPAEDPLLASRPTPSQRAVVKYFWIVSLLIVVQILMGVVTAHYGVEGSAFYGFPLAKVLPYALTRTWHTQLGVLWIATAWLAAGLYLGPAVSGVEPRGQRLGVNVLFAALLVLVAGSMVGQWLSVEQRLTGSAWFYFGHSGYEYIDLGRAFQLALLVGLLLWLFLVLRAIWPALRRKDEQRSILALFALSTVAIAGFYGAALGYTRNTNLAIVEYWRWWVVHLWVEGFFEVFATVAIGYLFARLKLVSIRTVTSASLLSSTIFLAGGIIGTLHHLYFTGTPLAVLALGSVFSALEVVPLLFVGFEAWHNLRLSRATPWVHAYRWPIYFFVAVAFWNLVGAGLFGFMINPPIALYYMQGLNTTPVHGHTALFGVYGMLGIGLMLFTLRALAPSLHWRDKLLAFAFWAINGGLALMVLISILPVGLLQTWAAVDHGYWYARSPEFLQAGAMNTLRWLRVPGDTIFAIGALALVAFVFTLHPARLAKRTRQGTPERVPGLGEELPAES